MWLYCVILGLAILILYQCVTDRHMTMAHHASIESHGKNQSVVFFNNVYKCTTLMICIICLCACILCVLVFVFRNIMFADFVFFI